MWILRPIALLVHLQVVMALSAAAYVETAGRLLVGHGTAWDRLLAAALGTLGIYLLDGLRSAELEDSVSQCERASLGRRHRGLLGGLAITALLAGGFLLLSGAPSPLMLGLLGIIGSLGLAHALPLPRLGSTGHASGARLLLKPLVVSLAWLGGAVVLAFASMTVRPTEVGADLLGFTLATLPLLLLDTLWLDRRDMRADARFGVRTLAAALPPRGFLLLRGGLLLSTLASLPWLPGGMPMLAGFWAGALWLVVLTPDRLRHEGAQVVLASLWRFSGLAAVLLLIATRH